LIFKINKKIQDLARLLILLCIKRKHPDNRKQDTSLVAYYLSLYKHGIISREKNDTRYTGKSYDYYGGSHGRNTGMAVRDYLSIRNEELSKIRGTLRSATHEHRNAFRSEWQPPMAEVYNRAWIGGVAWDAEANDLIDTPEDAKRQVTTQYLPMRGRIILTEVSNEIFDKNHKNICHGSSSHHVGCPGDGW
jgi:glycine/D-amino acid oxidase-like deaminating enzyme